VGSGSHGEQSASVISRFERVCAKENPDMVVVVGDVNSTIAAGLVAKKMHICLVHVEAGLRSGDRTMPEEINRLATDAITDIFFTTEKQGTKNLLREGKPADTIHFVGNVMVDNLFFQLGNLAQKGPSRRILDLKAAIPGQYLCLTLHRPSNVDRIEHLRPIIQALKDIALRIPVIFPCHPRTKACLENFGMMDAFLLPEQTTGSLERGLLLLEPMGYNDFLYLWKDALLVLTDSGGLQEETTALKIPCMTLRENTERPITVEVGSNVLIGRDMERLRSEVADIVAGKANGGNIPDLWDGKASERIAAVLIGHKDT
jgi:UDP-N-acetylglucosamine 2-epimerase (non-hydrolysing)